MKFYLDTMIWVYYFERHPVFFPSAHAVISNIGKSHTICASNLTLAEILVLPKRKADAFTAAQYRRFFLSPKVEMIAFSTEVAERFADLRASTRVKPADALHLALAASAGVDYFVTNDEKLHSVTMPGIAHICPSEGVPF